MLVNFLRVVAMVCSNVNRQIGQCAICGSIIVIIPILNAIGLTVPN